MKTQITLDSNAQDVTPQQITVRQLQHKLSHDADYQLFSCGQDRIGATITDTLTIRYTKEWQRDWYTIESYADPLQPEVITCGDIDTATRLINEILSEQ